MLEVLKDRDYLLYNYFKGIINETNTDVKKGNIRSITNDIITTLEYYLRDENFDAIYTPFSITSYSSLLYYIYLMITFFKSWKVYFLDPAVTINTDNRLENGNNYGSGIDRIAETKINYWKEDKEFKRDNSDVRLHIWHSDEGSTAEDRYKEILDVYGRYDPDPTSDHDYDGYTPTESITRIIDIDGGSYNGALNIPYNMINGS